MHNILRTFLSISLKQQESVGSLLGSLIENCWLKTVENTDITKNQVNAVWMVPIRKRDGKRVTMNLIFRKINSSV